MMKLFIRIKNGQPFEHPILDNNFQEAFPDINTEQLPEWVARFERIAPPSIGVYELYEGVTYEWFGEVVKDVHHVRPMTNDEKIAKQNEAKSAWAKYPGWNSWVFDEETCQWKAPIDMPADAGTGEPPKRYTWDESTISWKPME